MLTQIKRLGGALINDTIRAADHADSAAFDALEPRQLLAVNILNPIPDAAIAQNSSATVINLAGRYDNPELNGTIARFDTTLGAFNVVLYNNATPITVANFLRYVSEGRYADTIIHRNVPGFIVQGGGFQRPSQDNAAPATIASFGTIQNEPGISNLRGTIAMAKLGGNPNSATSQWFFNLADNSGNLNNQNGGFTVFGRVIGNGMTVVDAIAAVPRFNADSFYGTNGLYSDLPLRNFTTAPVKPENFVSMNITTIPELTYSVTSSNEALVNPSLNGSNLTLTYGANITGSSTVTVRTTAADGSFVEDTFLVTVVGPPAVGAVVAAPQPAVVKGQALTLTAKNITDITKSLTKVQFFHDANNDGVLDAEDTLLVEDSSSSGGWTARIDTAGLSEGSHRFFARGIGANGVAGPAAAVVHRVVPPPSIGALAGSTNTVGRNSTFNLLASGVTIPGAPLKTVEFYRDTNGNGVFDAGIDKKVAASSSAPGGTAAGKVSTKGFGVGDTMFFARAQDKSGAWGPAVAATITITNAAPTIATFKGAPAVVKNVGDPVTLSVSGKDLDGKIVRVQYFRDTEIAGEDTLEPGNGVLDDNDVLIGDITAGGFKLVYLTTRLPLSPNGMDRYFARAYDNDGGVSTIAFTDVRINKPPTVGDLIVTPSNGDTITTFSFSIAAADADGLIKSVELFRDTNGDGLFTARVDKSIGKAKLAGDRWVLAITGKKLGIGESRIFVRAADNLGGLSTTLNTVVTVA